ncbi:MAG: hypothetical protein ACOCV7_06245 [Desulfonatronovibrionaceae bacterium]
MELTFICPVQKKSFSSQEWSIAGSLVAVTDEQQGRRLEGTVEVFCPFCQEIHGVSPDEIPCPLTQPGSEQDETI